MPPCDASPARLVVFEQLGAAGRRENNGDVTKGFILQKVFRQRVALLHTSEFYIRCLKLTDYQSIVHHEIIIQL